MSTSDGFTTEVTESTESTGEEWEKNRVNPAASYVLSVVPNQTTLAGGVALMKKS
jgi:hypothetical protein